MFHTTVVYVSANRSASYHAQDVVGAGPHPAHQGCCCVETIYPCLNEHARSAAVPGQPHQHPGRVTELHTQCTVLPQATGIKRSIQTTLNSYLHFNRSMSEPVNNHIGSYGQCSALTLNIFIVSKIQTSAVALGT